MKTAIVETFRDEDVQATARILGGIALIVAWSTVALRAGTAWNFWVVSGIAIAFGGAWVKLRTPITSLMAVVFTVMAISVGIYETLGL